MIPFEDDWTDVMGKAKFGLGLSDADPVALGLDPAKLAALRDHPAAAAEPAVRAPFARLVLGSGFTSNGYVLGCPGTKQAVIVDPGADARTVIAEVDRLGVTPAAILITHGHGDHVGALDAVRRDYPVPVLALEAERAHLGARAHGIAFVMPGHAVEAGTLRLVVRHVPGHTDGMALFHDAGVGIAFTGDALFARSLGRASAPGTPYRTLLESVRREILSLPPETILCPGHGPLTTVADELRLNPFFP